MDLCEFLASLVYVVGPVTKEEIHFKRMVELDLVVSTFNPSTWEDQESVPNRFY